MNNGGLRRAHRRPGGGRWREAAGVTLVVWFFDGQTQAWVSWNRALPESLRALRQLVGVRAYFVVTEGASPWTWFVPPISAAAADAIVVDQVVVPDEVTENLLVFRHPTVLAAGTPVQPGEIIPGREVSGLTPAAPSYLYFIDDEPGARFEHDTRFVLVDATTGRSPSATRPGGRKSTARTSSRTTAHSGTPPTMSLRAWTPTPRRNSSCGPRFRTPRRRRQRQLPGSIAHNFRSRRGFRRASAPLSSTAGAPATEAATT